jgi:hypothetical protein
MRVDIDRDDIMGNTHHLKRKSSGAGAEIDRVAAKACTMHPGALE